MSELVAAYDSPSGTLDADSAASAIDFVDQNLATLQALAADEQLLQAVEEAVNAEQNPTTQSGEPIQQSRQSLTVEGDGFLRVTRICDGWEATPVADKEANGFLELIVGFSEAGVDPVLWGEFSACRYLVDTSRVRINAGSRERIGDIRAYVGEALAFEDIGTTPILFEIDATADIDDQHLDVALDFRIDPATQALELRVPTASGDLIALLSADAVVGIRAQNGEYACDLDARTCTADGQTISF